MERSLTVLLPVRDAEATLRGTVQEILDVVAELTRRFDLVIVDDGSTDGTGEVADELARHYPQVRVVHRGRHGPHDAAIRAGAALGRGEVILVRDEASGTPLDGLHQLWHAAASPTASAVAPPAAKACRGLLRAKSRPGFHLIHPQSLATRPPAGAEDREPCPAAPPGKPARPNYLARLKSLSPDEPAS